MPIMRVNTELSLTGASQSLKKTKSKNHLNPPRIAGAALFMKKLLLSLFALIAISSHAQISYGVKGGINLSYVRCILDPRDYSASLSDVPGGTGPKGNVTPAVRASAGGYVHWTFTKKIGVRAELLYQGQGSGKIKFDRNPGPIEKNKFDCIMIPVSLSWKIKPRVSILAGTYVSYVARVKDSFSKTIGLNAVDYGCQVGGEYTLTKKFAVGLTYYYGIGDMLSQRSVERLRTAQLYLAYGIK